MENKEFGAVVFVEDVPHYELTAQELIFPIKVEKNKFWVHMKPYAAASFKELMRATQPKFSTGKDGDFIVEPGNNERHRPFFDQHFIKASGLYSDANKTPASLDAQKRFFDNNPLAKIECVMKGYSFPIPLPEDDEETSEPSVGLILDGLENPTESALAGQVNLAYSNGAALPQDITVDTVHYLKPETEQHRISFVKATERSEIRGKRGGWARPENLEEIERLYNELIIWVSGTLVKGQKTEEFNKSEWVNLIPYWHKHRVIHRQFEGVNLKNVSSPKR